MSFGYDNPRFLNHVQAAALPLLLGIAARPGATWRMRAMVIVALTLQLFLLAATLGRSTMVGLLAATAIVLLVLGRDARRWLVIGLGAAVFAGTIYAGLQSGAARLQQTVGYAPTVKELTSDHSREYLWDMALSDARSSPWLGVGPMHFAHEVNAKGAHPHNQYLQAAAELGWPATMILVALMLRGIWAMARALRMERDVDRRAIGSGLIGACVAVAVDACFSGNLVMPVSQIWIFLVIGLSFDWYRGRSRSADGVTAPPIAGSAPVWLVVRMALVAVALWSCAAALEEIQTPTPHLHLEGGRVPSPHDVSRPRFWSYGWF
ncbi:O-antigen ligase family protein [Roseateles sp. UC29_93]|uniref:O-antigen ligase family protein n=1 Tax=Roseateles sp. UC29_93 TaxID=3350177 RepID=UPI00366B0B97